MRTWLVLLYVATATPFTEADQLCRAIVDQLTSCSCQDLVLMSGPSSHRQGVEDKLIGHLLKSGIPFFQYVITNYTKTDDILHIVRTHSAKQLLRHTTYVVTTARFRDVIDSADVYSKTAGIKTGLLCLHRTKWLILQPTVGTVLDYFRTRNRFLYDNVAVMSSEIPEAENSSSAVGASFYFYSLMWHRNRTRWFQKVEVGVEVEVEVDTTSDEAPGQCVLFPNLLNGLNGRSLTVITKVHWGFFVYVSNASGNPEYRGFVIDVFDTVASALNFSYTLVPYPNDNVQPTWDETAGNVTHGQADVSATLWSYSWTDEYNISVTYPVVVDSITGVYRKQKPSQEDLSLYILCPFNKITYVMLVCSIVYTLIIYVFIVGLVYPDENALHPRNVFHVIKRALLQTPPRPHACKPPTSRRGLYPRVKDTFWSILASVLNQAYLPSPVQVSARTLLFLWSLDMVMFYAIYTGSLTAEMVESSEIAPIRTFDQLVSRSDYAWGTKDNSNIDVIMENSQDGILHRLNQGKRNAPDGFLGDVYPTLSRDIVNLESGFVFIHFKSLLTEIVGKTPYPNDYFMMTESLMSANQGFIASSDSELVPLISQAVRRLQDTGMVQRLYDHYAYGNRRPVRKGKMRTRNQPLSLGDVYWPFFLVASLAVLSATVLACEKMMAPLKALAASVT